MCILPKQNASDIERSSMLSVPIWSEQKGCERAPSLTGLSGSRRCTIASKSATRLWERVRSQAGDVFPFMGAHFRLEEKRIKIEAGGPGLGLVLQIGGEPLGGSGVGCCPLGNGLGLGLVLQIGGEPLGGSGVGCCPLGNGPARDRTGSLYCVRVAS